MAEIDNSDNSNNSYQEFIKVGKEISVDPQQAIELAEKDLDFLAGLVLAEELLFKFPLMFHVLWGFLKEKVHLFRDFSKLAIGIPRGFAKTTLMKIFVVYLILFSNKKCIVVISYIEDHAINIIKDVCDWLSHPNIVLLFGDWSLNQDRKQQNCKIFAFRGRKIVLGAIGSNGSIRGLNIGNARPDVMIFEDFQKKKESENEELSKNLYADMIGTFMKSNSPFGCLYIFVANMYPTPGSILKKLKMNPDWKSFIVGAILEDGSSLWEELHPIKLLLEEYMSDLNAGCPEVFLAEKLNDENAGIKAGIDITKLPKCPFDEHEPPQGRAIVIDPALNNPKSDYNGIGLVGVYDGVPVLEKVKLGRYSPFELIKFAIILGFQTNTRLICVENVAMQSTYLFWFNKVCQDNGIEGFHFMPLSVGGYSKNSKIKTFLTEFSKGEVFVRPSVMPELLSEIIKWDPMKTKNQDTVLDLGTFCKKVIEQYMDLMLMPDDLEIQNFAKATPRTLEENCTF